MKTRPIILLFMVSLLAIVSVSTASSCEDCPPYAFVNANPEIGTVPLTVDFTCIGRYGNEPYSYHWDFGDGYETTNQNPTHIYSEIGTYKAECTVTDVDGDFDDDRVYIQVEEGQENLFPDVRATATPETGPEPLDVQFTCDATGGDEPYSFHWDFDDGTTSEEPNPFHTFSATGVYNTLCTVTDANGDQDSEGGPITVLASVHDHPPVADFMWTPPSPKVGEVVTFTTLATDPDNDIVLHEWDLNDDGIFEHYGMSGDFVFSVSGSYPVTHKVTDATGLSSQVTKTVFVTSDQEEPEPEPEPEPQSKAGWSSFRILNEEGLVPGDTMLVLVTVDNNGGKKMENARLTLLSYGLDVRDRIGPFDLRPGKMFSTIMYLDIPEYAPEGLYDLRAVLSSEDGVKRVKHRDFFINGPGE